jgi:alanine dehydrogenase
MAKKVRAIAYETVELEDGSLPLLRPMSEVAGRIAVQVGATTLEKQHGGKGILLGGVPGTRRGRVVIIGGGIVGSNSARIAVGMGAHVTVLDIDHERMAYLEDIFQGAIETLYSNPHTIEQTVANADLVIGAVLVAGAKTPVLIDRGMLRKMQPGSVIVDVAVDQGGCIETCRPTTHDNPTYIEEGVVHYCVANMPGAVAHTSTFALTNVTLKYALKIASSGVEKAVRESRALQLGVNCWDGACTYGAVAEGCNVPYTALEQVL